MIPDKMPNYPIEIGNREICVDVLFYYHKGFPGVMNPPDRAQPPEPEEVEIHSLAYSSGAIDETHAEMLMSMIEKAMEDEDFLLELEEACLQFIADERDRAEDAYWDGVMEARIDAAIAQSQEEEA